MKYIIYIRVSTDRQKLSMEAQLEGCLEYIKKKGEAPYEVFVDENVTSQMKMEDREQLQNALQAIKPGDVFLVYCRDRFGRIVMQNAITEFEIEKKKGKLVAVTQDDSDLDPGVATLMRTIIDAISQYERYQISNRTKRALAAKKARGERVGHVPYGKRLEGGFLIDDPEESLVLDHLMTLSRKGMSSRRVADVLNSLGFKNRNYKKHPGGKWTCGAVNRLYKNNIISSCVSA